ncbi:hypothetical protein [Chryseobacterium aquaticum]|uniref:hypothetical protein n=1 Tax=Chryseobacterium aquaticum TaxID=452084 RepID=UPI00103DD0D4|nr:hypothetical protein [Chryseobacterium aquaticum]
MSSSATLVNSSIASSACLRESCPFSTKSSSCFSSLARSSYLPTSLTAERFKPFLMTTVSSPLKDNV